MKYFTFLCILVTEALRMLQYSIHYTAVTRLPATVHSLLYVQYRPTDHVCCYLCLAFRCMALIALTGLYVWILVELVSTTSSVLRIKILCFAHYNTG
jgi:hypothetical protein